ncbi:hypothetical protein HDE68_002294 [Pedobacter cryoconitis]|uniref:Uncharacterized protein n=1 Tax=Pedobacter cryoconitis TaxID=188932 RepID=A0A7W8ZLU8_9SPHI|nr:hypothetical protein [Pedobacter cryoconitis]MBB5636393.1 hypothetical protein [Pedobacter cryoconitis]
MKDTELNKLVDLIDEVKKIDSMILLHQDLDDSRFMVDQYEAKKTQLISKLIDELVSPGIQSPKSFSLIQLIIAKFYPSFDQYRITPDDEIFKLAAAI